MSRLAAVCVLGWVVIQVGFSTSAAAAQEKPKPKVPIILDTDIGGDIDDALALGLVLTSPELELRGVTTVDGDAYTRALIVCRLLDVLERGKIPVASGAPPRKVPDFSGQMQYGLRPAHKRPIKESAVEFLAAQFKAAPGELTLVCIGPLTNIAALLDKHPEASKQIKRLVIMGGSIRTGYKGKPGAEAEWNILADKRAAQKAFDSGVPIVLVPLDVTATLELREDGRQEIFDSGTVLGRHLHALYQLWGERTPILFDPAAVAASIDESWFDWEELRIKVDDAGITQVVSGKPNAKVARKVMGPQLQKAVNDALARPVIAPTDLAPDAVIDIGEDNELYFHGNHLDPDDLAAVFNAGLESKLVFKSLTYNVHPEAGTRWRGRAGRATTSVRDLKAVEKKLTVHDKITSDLVAMNRFPQRVHVVENFETNVERRWWLAGKLETDHLPPGSNRAARAVLCNDFDDLQGDKYANYKAVIFNPVPGPPMGKQTRLSFRYYLKAPQGLQGLRVQIYSLSKGYHRQLTIKWLEQEQWSEATVDLTQARRPDGSGGPLSEDERIDDIQFYADPTAELLIDDIVLYDAADDATAAKEKRPFPKQIVFTGWFDTGKQGAEWPGDFEIVPHKPPLTWKAAKAVATPDGKSQWIRVDLRGPRPLPKETRLRFRYSVSGAKRIGVELGVAGDERRTTPSFADARKDAWAEADLDLTPAIRRMIADRMPPNAPDARDVVFRAEGASELMVDDVLLYEPGK